MFSSVSQHGAVPHGNISQQTLWPTLPPCQAVPTVVGKVMCVRLWVEQKQAVAVFITARWNFWSVNNGEKVWRLKNDEIHSACSHSECVKYSGLVRDPTLLSRHWRYGHLRNLQYESPCSYFNLTQTKLQLFNNVSSSPKVRYQTKSWI